MSKLVVMAAALTAVTSAYAQDVWDYKASVKNVYLKQVSVYDQEVDQKVQVYVKTVVSTSLKGYLIQGWGNRLNGQGELVTVPSAWLVVLNTGAKPTSYATPRILPAKLMAKWYDPTLKALKKDNAKFQAEGYLAVGSVGMWSQVEMDFPDFTFLDDMLAWDMTSAYLFGQFNSPSFDFGGQFDAWWETWMNHAGTGTACAFSDVTVCCGRVGGFQDSYVDTLSGSLKGGLYLCSWNGAEIDHSRWFEDRQGGWQGWMWPGQWENTNTRAVVQSEEWFASMGTDVLYGTWSIKYNTKLSPLDSADLPDWATDEDGDPINENVAIVNAAIKALKKGYEFGRDDNAVLFQNDNPEGVVSEKFAKASGLIDADIPEEVVE